MHLSQKMSYYTAHLLYMLPLNHPTGFLHGKNQDPSTAARNIFFKSSRSALQPLSTNSCRVALLLPLLVAPIRCCPVSWPVLLLPPLDESWTSRRWLQFSKSSAARLAVPSRSSCVSKTKLARL